MCSQNYNTWLASLKMHGICGEMVCSCSGIEKWGSQSHEICSNLNLKMHLTSYDHMVGFPKSALQY